MQPPDISKKIEPQIYTLLLEGRGAMFLSVHMAYSLEDAFSMAQNEFLKQNPVNPAIMQGATIKLFAIKTMNQLVLDPNIKPMMETSPVVPVVQITQIPIKKDPMPPPPSLSPSLLPTTKRITKKPILNKNELMKQIIESKSEELLKSNQSLFTKAEIKYLKEKIK